VYAASLDPPGDRNMYTVHRSLTALPLQDVVHIHGQETTVLLSVSKPNRQRMLMDCGSMSDLKRKPSKIPL